MTYQKFIQHSINLHNLHTQIYGVLSVQVVRERKHYHKQQATVVVVPKLVSFRMELQQHLYIEPTTGFVYLQITCRGYPDAGRG